MKRGFVFAALILGLGAGFIAGRFTGPRNSATSDDGSLGNDRSRPGRTRASDRTANPEALSSGKLRQEIRKASPDKLPPMVSKAMETVDPILRRQLLYDLFERMDAGNFRQMADEMDRHTKETGRDNYIEWLLIHTRAGQVAGAAAMEHWDLSEKGKVPEPAWRTLWGWASADPDAARRWLEQQTGLDPANRTRLLSALASGAIMRDPEKAKAILSSLSEPEKLASVGQFTFDIFQNGGKESAVDWLKSVRASEPDSAFSKRVSEQVFDKMINAGATQADTATMVSDLERLSSVMPIDENWISRGISQIRDRKVTGSLELLDGISRSSVLDASALSDRVWINAVIPAIQRDRKAVADWLARNTGSPIHAQVSLIFESHQIHPDNVLPPQR